MLLSGKGALKHFVQIAALGDAFEFIRVQRIDADVDALETRRFEGFDLFGQKRSVGGQAQVLEPIDRR